MTIIRDGSGNGPMPCPVGYTAVNSKYCIETENRDLPINEGWFSANTTCVNEDARLCTYGEWVAACQNGDITSDQFENEWIDGVEGMDDRTPRFPIVGRGSCTNIGFVSVDVYNVHFRCCMDR